MPIRSSPKPGSTRGSKPGEFPPKTAQIPAPEEVSHKLEAWFSAAARDLPWRVERSGYKALVSELMLQQTQVSRVVEAFDRFMERFPTVAALADAPEQSVLSAWQGLGYYRRARLLHRAAQAIRDHHHGQVPKQQATLSELPGVGRYTSGAIASIVFGERAPIVDGNVLRVLSRLADHQVRMGDRAAENWAWTQAERLVQAARSPAATNEAMMELGATVCVPATPRCGECPLASECQGRASGRAALIPEPRIAVTRRTLYWSACIEQSDAGILLCKRPATGLWSGMLQPPTMESDLPFNEENLSQAWSVPIEVIGQFTHVTSHRLLEFTVVKSTQSVAAMNRSSRWVPLIDLASVPLSNASWRIFECAGVPVKTPLSASAGRRESRVGPIAPLDS